MSEIMIKNTLPWDVLPEDEARAKRINRIAIGIGLCFLIIPFLHLPKPPRAEVEAMPERIARVMEQKIELPPPPPLPVEKKPEVKKDEAKPADKPAEDKPKVKPQPADEPVAKVKPTPGQVQEARGKAQKQLEDSGVADALADLRDFDTVATSKKPSTGGGLQKDSGAPVGTSRNMLTSRAGASSGGVAYGGPSSSGFGGGVAGGKGGKGDYSLGGKGTKDMKGGLIAGGDGSGAAGGRGGDGGKGRGDGGVGKRSQEDIRRVFDQNGGRLNNAYQRALKDDPSMQGTVRLKLVIDPSGKVQSCEVASSDLNNPELESKIVALVKGFSFGADEVEVWKGTYPVNFYPN